MFSILLLFSSCATNFTYYDNLRNLIKTENYPAAVSLIEQNKIKEYGEKNALLYYMDEGIVNHYSGDYEKSIELFTKAEKLAEELYTKSISQEAASFLVSDNVKSFYGEDFERILINTFQALNYLMLGRYEEALVEARKVDHKLKTLQVNYGNKNTYKEDAFMRYITGLIYESQKEYNDAFISFRKSIQEYNNNKAIYPFSTPLDLYQRTIKIAKKIGFREEFEEITRKYKLDFSWNNTKYDTESGEMVLIHYNGFAPYKIDHFIEVSFGEGWAYVGSVQVGNDDKSDVEKAKRMARSIAADEQFVVAFPKFVPTDSQIFSATIDIYKKDENNTPYLINSIDTFMVNDIDSIAIKTLEDKIGRIRAKAIARATIKFVLSRALSEEIEKKSSDALTSWIAKKAIQATATATEKADKRSWRTLPKNINFATEVLPTGNYKIEVKFYNRNKQQVATKVIDNLKIEKGKKTFITLRTAI